MQILRLLLIRRFQLGDRNLRHMIQYSILRAIMKVPDFWPLISLTLKWCLFSEFQTLKVQISIGNFQNWQVNLHWIHWLCVWRSVLKMKRQLSHTTQTKLWFLILITNAYIIGLEFQIKTFHQTSWIDTTA